jgi:hypothetical protein
MAGACFSKLDAAPSLHREQPALLERRLFSDGRLYFLCISPQVR